LTLFLNITSEHSDEFIPSWHKFFAGEIGLTHLQPFTAIYAFFLLRWNQWHFRCSFGNPNKYSVACCFYYKCYCLFNY